MNAICATSLSNSFLFKLSSSIRITVLQLEYISTSKKMFSETNEKPADTLGYLIDRVSKSFHNLMKVEGGAIKLVS